jgi:hypothetical protein
MSQNSEVKAQTLLAQMPPTLNEQRAFISWE